MSLTPTQLQELQTIVLDLGEEFPHNADALWNAAIRMQKGDLGPVTGSGGLPAFEAAVADIKVCQEEVQHYQQRQGSPNSGFDVAVLQSIPLGDPLPSGNIGEIMYIETAPNTWAAVDQILITPAGPNSVQMDEVGTTVFRTVPAASGGIEINNLSTGAGFERVLTTADLVPASGQVNSVVGGVNISVNAADPVNPIVNLDAAITGVSVNAVTLSAAGAATNYLDETGAYSVPPSGAVTFLEDGAANVALIANGSGRVALRSVGNTDAELRILDFNHQDGTNRGLIGFEAGDSLIIRNSINNANIIFNCGIFGGSRLRMHLDGTSATGGVTLYAGTSGLGRLATSPEGVRIQNGTLFLAEQAAQEANDAGFGQLFVDSADDSLHYITEAGVDTDLTAGGGGSPFATPLLVETAGNVAIGGSQTARVGITRLDASPLADWGFFGAQELEMKSYNHGARFLMKLENTAGVERQLVVIDPDTGFFLTAMNTFSLTMYDGTTFRTAIAATHTGSNGVDMRANGVLTCRVTNGSAGGLLALNQVTGTSLERVLTISDLDTAGNFDQTVANTVTWASASGSTRSYASGAIARYASGVDFRFDDNAILKFGTGDDYQMLFNAANLEWNGPGGGSIIIVTAIDQFRIAGSLGINEAAAPDGNVAGVGQYWVRNDVPNTPMFRDDAGNDFVLNSGGGAASELKVKSADQTVNNSTTLVADNHLTGFALVAGERYKFHLEGEFVTSAAASMDFDIVFTNAPQAGGRKITATINQTALGDYENNPLETEERLQGAAGTQTFRISGWFQANASTGGTVGLEWAQGVAEVSNTQILASAWMEVVQTS